MRTTIGGGKEAGAGSKRTNAESSVRLGSSSGRIDGLEGGSKDPEEAYESVLTDRYTFTEGMFSKYVSTASTTDSYGKYGSSSEIDFSARPANNLNIDVFGIDWTEEEIYSCPLHLLGVGGKRSERLPSEYKARYADLDEDGNVEGEETATQ